MTKPSIRPTTIQSVFLGVFLTLAFTYLARAEAEDTDKHGAAPVDENQVVQKLEEAAPKDVPTSAQTESTNNSQEEVVTPPTYEE